MRPPCPPPLTRALAPFPLLLLPLLSLPSLALVSLPDTPKLDDSGDAQWWLDQPAAFGPAVPDEGVTGFLVEAKPDPYGCTGALDLDGTTTPENIGPSTEASGGNSTSSQAGLSGGEMVSGASRRSGTRLPHLALGMGGEGRGFSPHPLPNPPGWSDCTDPS